VHRQSGFLWLKRACLALGLLALFFFVSFLLLVFATLLLLFEVGCLVQGTLLQRRNVSGSITASRANRGVMSDNLNDYNVLLVG
jgi:hypothetical protein